VVEAAVKPSCGSRPWVPHHADGGAVLAPPRPSSSAVRDVGRVPACGLGTRARRARPAAVPAGSGPPSSLPANVRAITYTHSFLAQLHKTPPLRVGAVRAGHGHPGWRGRKGGVLPLLTLSVVVPARVGRVGPGHLPPLAVTHHCQESNEESVRGRRPYRWRCAPQEWRVITDPARGCALLQHGPPANRQAGGKARAGVTLTTVCPPSHTGNRHGCQGEAHLLRSVATESPWLLVPRTCFLVWTGFAEGVWLWRKWLSRPALTSTFPWTLVQGTTQDWQTTHTPEPLLISSEASARCGST